jgi:predicted AAA+ superfamily ATPase
MQGEFCGVMMQSLPIFQKFYQSIEKTLDFLKFFQYNEKTLDFLEYFQYNEKTMENIMSEKIMDDIQRPEYISKLARFKDKDIIKVVTGIRRCGKSTLLGLFRDYLKKNGVEPARIQAVNMEDAANSALLDYNRLHDEVLSRLVPDKMNYVFLDEIQNVPEFQRAIDSLYIRKNIDLYVSGSNAWLLSGELATLLSGRYVEIPMLPLSFKEYLSAFDDRHDLPSSYRDYLSLSSFPYTLKIRDEPELIHDYLGGIYHTIVFKDVLERKKIADPLMLSSVIRFMFDNIGNLSSTKKITDTLVSAGRKIAVNTVESYLSALTDSFILYPLGRYDVKGKQHLKTGGKYYLADLGLRYYLLGSEGADAGRMLENIVYLELLRRKWRLSIGKVDNMEVDFVAENWDRKEYYQVALTVRDEATLERELRPLNAIRDHNPKYLITMDPDPPASWNGIRQVYALDWLLEE